MSVRSALLTISQPLEFDYKGVMLKIDRDTGKVIDPSQVPFEANAAIKFTGAGEKPDWKDFKVGWATRLDSPENDMWPATDPTQAQVIKVAIPTPFLAAPPGSNGGSVAKNDGSAITDEELQKLKDAKLLYGGVEVEWSRMTGECTGVRLRWWLQLRPRRCMPVGS